MNHWHHYGHGGRWDVAHHANSGERLLQCQQDGEWHEEAAGHCVGTEYRATDDSSDSAVGGGLHGEQRHGQRSDKQSSGSC